MTGCARKQVMRPNPLNVASHSKGFRPDSMAQLLWHAAYNCGNHVGAAGAVSWGPIIFSIHTMLYQLPSLKPQS